MKPKVKNIRWQALQSSDREHLVLTETDDSIVAESVYLSGGGPDAFGVCYRLVCNKDWTLRQFESQIMGVSDKLLIRRNESGAWDDGTNEVGALKDAIDFDVSISPFTNTLAIRRLRLAPGESADIAVAYVSYPAHTVMLDPQRYICKSPTEYIFESVDSDFKSEITVDEDGLVVYYPELFARIG